MKGDSLPGLLIIGTFEKRAPGPLGPCALWKLFCCLKLVVNSCSGQIIWFEKKYFPQKSFQELWLSINVSFFWKENKPLLWEHCRESSRCFFNNCSQAGLGSQILLQGSVRCRLWTIVFSVRKRWDFCCHVLICMVKTIVCSLRFTLTNFVS